MANNLELAPSAILGAPGGHFGFCRQCGVAGSERVPPAPLGLYSNSKILKFTDFQALDPNFIFAQAIKVLKFEGSSYGIRRSIYVLKG